jgi:hypothetical protein
MALNQLMCIAAKVNWHLLDEDISKNGLLGIFHTHSVKKKIAQPSQ